MIEQHPPRKLFMRRDGETHELDRLDITRGMFETSHDGITRSFEPTDFFSVTFRRKGVPWDEHQQAGDRFWVEGAIDYYEVDEHDSTRRFLGPPDA